MLLYRLHMVFYIHVELQPLHSERNQLQSHTAQNTPLQMLGMHAETQRSRCLHCAEKYGFCLQLSCETSTEEPVEQNPLFIFVDPNTMAMYVLQVMLGNTHSELFIEC